jgi:hypothetical protein
LSLSLFQRKTKTKPQAWSVESKKSLAAKNGVFIKTYMDYKIIDISRNKLKVRISFVKITVRSEVKTLVSNIFHSITCTLW